MTKIVAIPRTGAYPFPVTGVSRDPAGIAHYDGLPASLVAMLRARAETRPHVEAVVEVGGSRLTYQQLWDTAARVAGGLRAAGIRPGDRVAVRYTPGLNWVLTCWGTLLAGGIVVAVNTRWTGAELEYALTDAGVKLTLPAGLPLPYGEGFVYDEAGPDDVALIFYTSGTTGRPKGVPVTHHACLTSAESTARGLGLPAGIGAGLRTLITVPLFHVTGCDVLLVPTAYLGGTAVILPALDLAALLAALPGERITFLLAVPAVYALLLRHPGFAEAQVTGVRWAAYGGAPIAPSLVLALKAAFPASELVNGYGMTETSGILTALPDRDAAAHTDSAGFPVPVVDLAVDPLGTDPHVGELLVRGPNVLAGYWGDAAASAAAFTDGWLRTGDVVSVDDDGRVRIVDRLKDIINRGGENVSSVEVEDALLSAPGVREAAVLGVPDEVMGEKVGAVLVAADGAVIDVGKVVAHCAERLAAFKVPQYVAVASEPLPRNAGGKVLKARLREQVEWGNPVRLES
jgi:acyl-CoA synthetase (AMP-forming)/AMP-acid ligase II